MIGLVLFRYCQTSHPNVWKLVCQLERPETFASFIETGDHISEDERHKYHLALQSGDFGPEMLERPRAGVEQPQPPPSTPLESGHRFTCHVCNEDLLGHRFRCAHCFIETQAK